MEQSAAMYEGLRGQVAEARSRLAELESRLAAVSTSPQDMGELRIAQSWVEQAGRAQDRAYELGLRAADSDPGGWSEVQGLIHACRAALWLEDMPRARSAFDRLTQTNRHGNWLECTRDTLHTGLIALEGRREEAIDSYLQVADRWRALGVRLDLALAHLDMITLLGPEHPEAVAAATEAREIFTGLGAKPFVERVDSAIADQAVPAIER
jgi:hypothetical protein